MQHIVKCPAWAVLTKHKALTKPGVGSPKETDKKELSDEALQEGWGLIYPGQWLLSQDASPRGRDVTLHCLRLETLWWMMTERMMKRMTGNCLLAVCLSAYLSVRLSVCLPFLSVWLLVCLPADIAVCRDPNGGWVWRKLRSNPSELLMTNWCLFFFWFTCIDVCVPPSSFAC